MADTKEIFIDVKSKLDGAYKELERLAQKLKDTEASAKAATKALSDNAKEQERLSKALEGGEISVEDFNEQSARLVAQQQQLTNEWAREQAALKGARSEYASATKQVLLLEKADSDTLEGKRALLALMKQELSTMNVESKGYKELSDKINNLNTEVKGLEGGYGDFQRNVGNYQSVWDASTEKLEGFGKVISNIFGENSVVTKATKTVVGFAQRTNEARKGVNDITDSLKGTSSAAMEGSEQVEKLATATAATSEASDDARVHIKGFASGAKTAEKAEKATAVATKGLTATLKTMGRQLLALMANPIVLTIAAIAVAALAVYEVFKKLVDVFKKNDAAMTALDSLMAAFRPILDLVAKALAKVAEWLGKVIEGLSAFVQSITNAIPFLREYAQAEEDIVRASDNLEEAERRYTVSHAKRERDIAELTNKANETQKYSYSERKKYIEQAIALEKADMEEAQKNAKEKLRIAKEKAKLDNDTSDETTNALAELQAAVYDAEKEYNEGTRRLSKKLDTFVKEERQRQQAAIDERRKRLQAMADKELEILQQRQDGEVALYKSTYAAMLAQLNLQHEREVAALRKKLSQENDLTAKAKEDLLRLLQLKDAAYNTSLQELTKQHLDELANLQKSNDELQVSLMAEGTGKINAQFELRRRDAESAYEQQVEVYKREVAALGAALGEQKITRLQYNKAVESLNEQLLEQQVAHDLKLSEVQRQQQNDLNKYYEGKLNEQLTALTTSLAAGEQAVANDVYKKAELYKKELASIEEVKNAVAALTEEQAVAAYGSLETWRQAVERLGTAYSDMATKSAEANKAAEEATSQASSKMLGEMSSAMGATISLFDDLAEKDTNFARLSEGLSYANILMSSAQSIGSAIKGATEAAAAGGAAAPFLVAGYIASMVATVVSGISSAMAAHEKAQEAINNAKYAEGGLVRGAGTATSDSISARLSNGESVLTAKATALHYDTLSRWNVEGGGRPFPGTEGLRHFAEGGVVAGMNNPAAMIDALKAALAEVRPVVSVKEIAKVQSKVNVKEKLSRR